MMSTSVGLALSLLPTRASASLEAPQSLRAGVTRLGADELVVLEHPLAAGAAAAAGKEPPGGRFAGLRAIHACYAAEPTTEGWMRGILLALRELAPSGRWFGWSDGLAGGLGPGLLLSGDGDVTADPVAGSILGAVGRECYRDLLRPRPPVQLLSHRLRSLPPALEQQVAGILRARGLPDAVLLFGGELDGQAIALGMAVAPGVRPPSRTIGLLRSVAGHLNSARRLRGRLGLGERGAPRGVAPAGLDARSVAREAVAALEDSSAVTWADATGAARLWRGLVDGAYALIDHWAAGGRAVVLARRCQGPNDPAALRPAEAAALAYAAHGFHAAEIGELLGVSAATVTLHLTSARARLRCGTRRELVRLVTGPARAA